MQLPWYVTALAAALIWGIHYPLIDNALKKVSLFSVLLLTALPVVLLTPFYFQNLRQDISVFTGLGLQQQLAIAAIGFTSVMASVLLFMSIDNKNATLASLIEITYPVFVALFAFVMFRHVHLTASAITGGVLVIAGVAIIIINNP